MFTRIFGGTIFAVIVFFVLTVIFGSWFTIDQTERGVLLRNGAVVGVVNPGLSFKKPWIESVVDISVKTVTYTWDNMEAYSADQQPAHLKVSVTLAAVPDGVDELYSKFGTLDAAIKALVSPHVNQQVKVIFGQFSAVKAISDRAKLNIDVKDAIVKSIGNTKILSIESIQIENIAFSPEYIKQVELRAQAEIEVLRLRQVAEREKVQAQIAVTQAQGRADSVLAEAKASADATRLRGEAEAAAIKARGDALKDNQAALVALTQAERWNGALPHTMLPGSAVPMLTLPASK